MVALIATSIAMSSDPEAGMGWIIFVYIDFPIALH